MSDYFILYHRKLQFMYEQVLCVLDIYILSLHHLCAFQCPPSFCILFVRPQSVSSLSVFISVSSLSVLISVSSMFVFS